MVVSHRSPKGRSLLRPINTKCRLNAVGLGIRGGLRSAVGSTTQVEFPPSPPRKSSLRDGSKTPSPDANRVRFAAGDSPQAPRTQRRRTKTATVPRAPRKMATKTQQRSPTLRFSPITAQKAREAAKVTKTIRDQADFIDDKNDSPEPSASKAFNGTGIKLSSGLPSTLPKNSKVRDGSSVPSITKTDLPTPPYTAMNTPTPTPAPRTVTITESPTKQRRFYVDGVSDWLSGPSAPRMQFEDGEKTMEIPTKVLLEHMHHLKHHLRVLSLEEIHIQFYLLQKMLRQFSKKYFTAAWSAEQTAGFDLAGLSSDHAPFFRMMQYIADGSGFKNGWGDFLTSEHTRPHIAYGVLAEWLKYNVFGHSCFGLSTEEDAAMTNIDIQYLNWDGSVRTKERAKLLKDILANKPDWEQELDMSAAVEKVVADLLVVLTPILPSCTKALKAQLRTLIDVAANLHLCIRLTGINGTIVRLHSSSKGDQFACTARQNCINKSTVTATLNTMIAQRNAVHAANANANAVDEIVQRADGFARIARRTTKPREEKYSRRKDKLIIKMPCFPLVQAVVPYGPTLRDFAVEQDLYEKIIRSEDLPALATKGPMYIEDIPAEIVRAACFEEMPESCHKDYERRLRVGEKRSTAFGSYVNQYILNESDVYCEWQFAEEEVSVGLGLTLRQALEQAQREKYGYVPAERRARRREIARNAKYAATAGVAAAMVFSITNRAGITDAAVSAIKNLTLPSNFSVDDIKGAVSSAMKTAGTRTKLFRQAAARPFGIGKHCAKKWVYRRLAYAQSRVGQLRNSTGIIADGLRNAAEHLTSDISANGLNLPSAAAHLKDAATSAVKEAVLPEEPVEPTLTSSLLSSILQPITVGVHEIPAKLSPEIAKVAEPTSRVSKSTKTGIQEQATETETKAVKRWWYERFARGVHN